MHSNDDSIGKSQERDTAQADLDSLVRVSHRLAMIADTERLTQVLDKLLPRLLHKIGENRRRQKTLINPINNLTNDSSRQALQQLYDQTHQKLVETLSHIMKRVRNDVQCQLPCEGILHLLVIVPEHNMQQLHETDAMWTSNPDVDPVTIHMALAFLTIGIPRSPIPRIVALLPALLVSQPCTVPSTEAQRSVSRQMACLLVKSMERISSADLAGDEEEKVLNQCRRLLSHSEATSATIFELFLDILLYQYTTSDVPPDGLSQMGHQRLQSSEQIIKVSTKLALLEFVASSRKRHIFPTGPRGTARMLSLLVVAAADSNSLEVAERAAGYLKIYVDTFRRADTASQTDVPITGEPTTFISTLIMICFGQLQAQSLIPINQDQMKFWLGNTTLPEGSPEQLVLSTKRRPVSESTMAGIISFLAGKIMEDDPLILERQCSESWPIIGSLITKLCHRTLSACTSVYGMTLLRAKPYRSAAELLRVLTIRLANLYDNHPVGWSNETIMKELLLQILVTACGVLAPLVSQPGLPTGMPSQGAGTSEGNFAIRDACYGCICSLARCPFAFLSEGYIFTLGDSEQVAQTATLLFGCAAKEEERLRPRAVAALDALLACYSRVYCIQAASVPKPSQNPWFSEISSDSAIAGDQSTIAPVNRSRLLSALIPVIWNASQSHQSKSSRLAAARWAGELIRELEATSACHVLCFLAGDNDPTAASTARCGLGLVDDDVNRLIEVSSNKKLPDFGQFVSTVFTQGDRHAGVSYRSQHYGEFSYQGKATTLRFAMVCLMHDFYGGTDESIELYYHALSDTLREFRSRVNNDAPVLSSIELLDCCSVCLESLLSSSDYARRRLLRNRSQDSFSFHDVRDLTFYVQSSRARRFLAHACGRLVEDPEIWTDHDEDTTLEKQLEITLEQSAKGLHSMEIGRAVVSEVHGSAFVGAHMIRALLLNHEARSLIPTNACCNHAAFILDSLGRGTLHADEALGNACADSISIALGCDNRDPPELDARLLRSCSSLLRSLAKANRNFGGSDQANPSRVIKCALATGHTLAATTLPVVLGVHNQGDTSGDLHLARSEAANSLFDLLGSVASQKQEEIAVVVGEALACYADVALWSFELHTESSEWPADFNDAFARGLHPHEFSLYVLLRSTFKANSPQKRTSTAPALLALAARAASRIHKDPSYSGHPLFHVLLRHLEEIQDTFIILLSDPKSKHLSRESCCLGLAACRGLLQASTSNQLSHDSLTNRLLRAFGQTAFSGSAMQETREQAAQRRAASAASIESIQEIEAEEQTGSIEVGGASGIGEAALGAYREMASACVALGRHDVLYALLILSISHPYWFAEDNKDRYSMIALLGNNSFSNENESLHLKDILRPHLSKLLPRILRARHDPNQQTRDQMESIWNGLTGGGADARLAISEHLLSAIDCLLLDTSSKLWRVRFGSCAALAEIIVGREWAELGGGGPVLNDDDLNDRSTHSAGVRLLRLWRAAIRALDDVRINVRESGGNLARSLKGLTIRLCDASVVVDHLKKRGRASTTSTSDVIAAAATSLRWLIRHGLNQDTDATSICLSTLVDIVGLVTPKMLEPILPDLLRSLLLAISGLEPAALNYLQQKTSDPDHLERSRLQLAQSGPIAVAVQKCVDLMPNTSVETQQAVIIELDTALRLSSGFATRAITADTISTLCGTCPTAFHFGGSGVSNPSVRLLRALYYASEREKTSTSRDRLVYALGNLSGLCPASSVRSIAIKACHNYNRSSGSSDDPVSRKASAMMLRSIVVRAQNQVKDGGKNDVWCRSILPVAFLGRKDTDAKVALIWQEVWDEGGNVALSDGRHLIGTTVEENLLEELTDECIRALQDYSWARRVSGCKALTDLCSQRHLGPLPKSSSDSSLDRAHLRSKCSRKALKAAVDLIRKPRMWSGKDNALKAVGIMTEAWAEEMISHRIVHSAAEHQFSPLSFHLATDDDLFEGDGWFSISKDTDEREEEQLDSKDESHSAGDPRENYSDDMEESDLCKTVAAADTTLHSGSLLFTGLCRLLLQQANPTETAKRGSDDGHLTYRKASFECMKGIIAKIPPTSTTILCHCYEIIAPALVKIIENSCGNAKNATGDPPVLVASAIDCLSKLYWKDIGGGSSSSVSSDVDKITSLLADAGGKLQPAWTIREAAATSLAHLVVNCDAQTFRRHDFLTILVDTAAACFDDQKFWRVRFSGLSILRDLVSRAGNTTDTKHRQLVLEALLPHKESIVNLLRRCLSDTEPKITALSTNVLSMMSWWP